MLLFILLACPPPQKKRQAARLILYRDHTTPAAELFNELEWQHFPGMFSTNLQVLIVENGPPDVTIWLAVPWSLRGCKTSIDT